MTRVRLIVAGLVAIAAVGGGTAVYLANDTFEYEASPERLAELEEQRIKSEADLKEQEAEAADAFDGYDETIRGMEADGMCGKVVNARHLPGEEGQPTFLDLGAAYPDPGRLSVVIWGQYRGKFDSPPETEYLDRYICINAFPYDFNGVKQVEVKAPFDIMIPLGE